jgi:tetratricopeptide (TPR) repeat protein
MGSIRRFALVTVLIVASDALLFAQTTEPTRDEQQQRDDTSIRSSSTEDAKAAEGRQAFFSAFEMYNAGNYAAAMKLYGDAYKTQSSNPRYQNEVAWAAATCPDEKIRLDIMAVGNAADACRATDYKNPTYLDTYAAALAEKGLFDKAVSWQQKAIELAKQDEKSSKQDLSSMQLHLSLYKRETPYREVPRPAIFAEYERIVGTKLSRTSLRQISDDHKSQLIAYLRKVPLVGYMEIDETVIDRHFDVLLLLLTSDSLGDGERCDWARKLSRLPSDQLKKLHYILINEREELDDLHRNGPSGPPLKIKHVPKTPPGSP